MTLIPPFAFHITVVPLTEFHPTTWVSGFPISFTRALSQTFIAEVSSDSTALRFYLDYTHLFPALLLLCFNFSIIPKLSGLL